MGYQANIRLYGDNSECFGEIDQATLTREWNYLQQFPRIFSPYGAGSGQAMDSALYTPKPTPPQPEIA